MSQNMSYVFQFSIFEFINPAKNKLSSNNIHVLLISTFIYVKLYYKMLKTIKESQLLCDLKLFETAGFISIFEGKIRW
jgi:hypothetical protein